MSDFPRIFAHRGASSLAPENTIAAFSKAMEVGARWFEFDVDIIGDGSLIVIHDDTLDRTTNGSGSYYQLGFSDIRRLDAGRWFSDTYRFERIPEAADALAFAHAQQMGVNLEIKPCAGGARLRERLIESLAVTLRGEKVPASSSLPSITSCSPLSTRHAPPSRSAGSSSARPTSGVKARPRWARAPSIPASRG